METAAMCSLYIYVCMYIYVYIYMSYKRTLIHTHTHKHTHLLPRGRDIRQADFELSCWGPRDVRQ
jgi:hypothetical protein